MMDSRSVIQVTFLILELVQSFGGTGESRNPLAKRYSREFVLQAELTMLQVELAKVKEAMMMQLREMHLGEDYLDKMLLNGHPRDS
jgi:hypothetical protein